MENPIASRSLLKAWTWRLLFLITLIQIIVYTSIAVKTLQGHTDAPGVQPPPGRSRFGKVNSPHPGPSFSLLRIFEHNVYYQGQSDTKPNLIWFSCNMSCAILHNTNYITDFSIKLSKEYLVSIAQMLSTSYPHCIPDLGNHLTLGLKVIYKMCREVTGSEQKQPYTRLGDYLGLSIYSNEV